MFLICSFILRACRSCFTATSRWSLFRRACRKASLPIGRGPRKKPSFVEGMAARGEAARNAARDAMSRAVTSRLLAFSTAAVRA